MPFKDYAERLLRGGLPAVLDNPGAAIAGPGDPARTRQGDSRPEQTAPEPTNRDREPFLSTVKEALTPMNITLLVGAVVAIGIVIYFVRK